MYQIFHERFQQMLPAMLGFAGLCGLLALALIATAGTTHR